MGKFAGKYRIDSNRLPEWDYSGNGQYFITLVTNDRLSVFGKIENHKMIENEWGQIVLEEWDKSFKIRAELFCNEFVLMPNHLHAIVTIKKPTINNGRICIDEMSVDGTIAETHGRVSLQSPIHQQFVKNPQFIRKPKSLSSFVAGFKSSVTTRLNNWIDKHGQVVKYYRDNKLWQPNYHDHVIRNQEELYRIAQYIRNNPVRWNDDKFFEH